MFASHGSYEISLLQNNSIVKVKFIGAWNKEAVFDFFDDLKKCPLAERWVAIADLTEWEGATPELTEAYLPVVDWCLAHGECATGHIYAKNWQYLFVEKLRLYRSQSIPQMSFTDESSAIVWANSQLHAVAV
ncbi:hypothetical protein EZV61_11465 [Corallincola luteus]|uniref:STAS/SEC14 domain-containing protein n=1 Tax=Corallincola luteus TaxID=1775177 RepID=A0ABY2AJC4_9GAMM|nr:hypothetical protein [Corallincola luteus]TCI02906.1 hypothetical protein EZV61_11465 [Corallincola luteus]